MKIHRYKENVHQSNCKLRGIQYKFNLNKKGLEISLFTNKIHVNAQN